MIKSILLFLSLAFSTALAFSQQFTGANMGLGNISKVSDGVSRSITPENYTGEKGKAAMADPIKQKYQRNVANAFNASRELGVGWKVNPYVILYGKETLTLADIDGEGIIQHIWMTPIPDESMTNSVLRFYWDGEKTPSVEVPLGAFFGQAWQEYATMNSLPMAVNPKSGFNSFWPMPFRKRCKITLENQGVDSMGLFYQIDYLETKVDKDEAYFHAEYRRSNPTEGGVHTLVDGIKGQGQYVGTYLGIQINNNRWWGEGEVKFYLDGDKEFPSITSTGLEDYFLGSFDFEDNAGKNYVTYSGNYAGLHQVIKSDGLYKTQPRYGMYRWHIMDPVRFKKDLKVTVQDLGWRSKGRYLIQKSNIISVSFWYQMEPHAAFKKLPNINEREIN